MLEKIDIPVTVYLIFNAESRSVEPRALVWNGRTYKVSKVGLHHKYKQGRILFHVFSVASKDMFFRLIFNTENLQWRLKQISDGMAN